jgi:hypothetical protein
MERLIKLASKIELRKINEKSTRALRIYLVFYYIFSRHFVTQLGRESTLIIER